MWHWIEGMLGRSSKHAATSVDSERHIRRLEQTTEDHGRRLALLERRIEIYKIGHEGKQIRGEH